MRTYAQLNEFQLTRCAQSFASLCPQHCIIFLYGDLGVGKTTFVRALLKAWGSTEIIKSPTYTLVEPYVLPSRRVFHFDFYRISNQEELEIIGLRDYFSNEAVFLIEWPQIALSLLPHPDLTILFSSDHSGRTLNFQTNHANINDLLRNLTID